MDQRSSFSTSRPEGGGDEQLKMMQQQYTSKVSKMKNNYLKSPPKMNDHGISFDSTDPLKHNGQVFTPQSEIVPQAKKQDILFNPGKRRKSSKNQHTMFETAAAMMSPQSTTFSKMSKIANNDRQTRRGSQMGGVSPNFQKVEVEQKCPHHHEEPSNQTPSGLMFAFAQKRNSAAISMEAKKGDPLVPPDKSKKRITLGGMNSLFSPNTKHVGTNNNKTLLMLKDKLQQNIQENKKKPCMIYPNNECKAQWDTLITIVLIFTCMVTPYRIAFIDEDDVAWIVTNNAIDILFLIDMLLCFLSAYYTDEFELIEDRTQIAKAYITSWFVIDVLAIFPFERVQSSGGESSNAPNDMVRLAKLGRLYKVLRLIKLVRLLKLGKSQNNFFSKLKTYLHISMAFERLTMFTVIFAMICHIVSCLWIIIAGFQEGDENSWLTEDYKAMQDSEQYLTSFYFTITTITTVGYGDISGGTIAEKIGAIVLMLLGVISFSVASASLSSIFASFDQGEAALREKMSLLRKLQSDYNLPLKLCSDIVKNLRSNFKQELDEKSVFVEELPHNLRQEICIHMYQDIYKNIDFLKSKDTLFLSWICPILRSKSTIKGEYIYQEGDDVKCVYFNTSGSLGFVLRKYQNAEYVKIGKGSFFGLSDIIGCMIDIFEQGAIENPDIQLWIDYMQKLRRMFTVLCYDNHQMFILTLQDFYNMRTEYKEYYDELFKNGFMRLQKLNAIKQDSSKQCQQKQFQWITASNADHEKQPLTFPLKIFQMVSIDRMKLKDLYKQLKNVEMDQKINKLIRKYKGLLNDEDIDSDEIEEIHEEEEENIELHQHQHQHQPVHQHQHQHHHEPKVLDMDHYKMNDNIANSFETDRNRDINGSEESSSSRPEEKNRAEFELYKNSEGSNNGQELPQDEIELNNQLQMQQPLQVEAMMSNMFSSMQKKFMEQINENQNKQMEEMQKNLKELKNRNDRYEKLINELTKEVRGYKDAVSEHTGSINGRNTDRDNTIHNTIDAINQQAQKAQQEADGGGIVLKSELEDQVEVINVGQTPRQQSTPMQQSYQTTIDNKKQK